MNKGFKIIKINGFRGLLMALFVVGCTLTGFIVFPAWILSKLWNHILAAMTTLPTITLVQGAILWAIIALMIYQFTSRRFSIGFGRVMSDDLEERK